MSVRGAAPERRLERFAFAERVAHMGAAFTYLYLLLTGLAFWSPALFWFATVLGGGFLARVLHVWVGFAFSMVLGWMYFRWRRVMAITDADRAWRKAIVAYVRHRDDEVPPCGKFNFGQKQLFWIMVWSGLVLAASGFVLWAPQWWPLAVRQTAVLLHGLATLVTVAGFIVHVYMGVFVVPGSMHAIVRGDVTELWARHHHALWAAELSAGQDGADTRSPGHRRDKPSRPVAGSGTPDAAADR